MKTVLIRDAQIVNEGSIEQGNVLIRGGVIHSIGKSTPSFAATEIDGRGKFLLPGVIDDQVHFREPGFTHKADIYTESRAAVAGGVTSFMDMPNTKPQALTQELLQEKYALAAQKSLANYSFYMGVSNDNLDEVLKTDRRTVCGIKIFLGGSTGNMLVDDHSVLEAIFEKAQTLIATHCEKEEILRKNRDKILAQYGNDISAKFHPIIRSEEACYESTESAVHLAKKHNTRLHVLHVSTAKELELFEASDRLSEKQITAEVCIHHLWFCDEDYERLGNRIRWNPAIKTKECRKALLNGLLENRLDVIATDHAPHTIEEKDGPYDTAPSGGPMVQHSLVAMLEFYHQGKLSLENVVEKMCHAPAECFQVDKRGYVREGYWGDLVLVDLQAPWTVSRENILYKCGWSPFEGQVFSSRVTHTLINGSLVYCEGSLDETVRGKRLVFNR